MRPPHPVEPGSPYAAHGTRAVHEKLQILRVLRGLDRIGADPGASRALRTALVRLAEVDQLLTLTLEFLERAGCGREEAGTKPTRDALPQMFMAAEQARAEVRDALSAADQRAFDRARGEVAAIEPEIWMQVDDFRAQSGARRGPGRSAGRRRDATPGPLSDDDAAALAARAWSARTKDVREANHPKATAFERRLLPGPSAPLLDWLTHLPPEWLRGIARMHDVDPDAGASLAAQLAARLVDPAWIARFLAERAGASERERLAWLLQAPEVLTPGSEDAKAFAVPWDWSLERPASTGGKLRSAGFVQVGVAHVRDADARTSKLTLAVVPPPLASILREALAVVAPDALHRPAAAVGSRLAEQLDGTPFGDPELDRWKAADRAVSELVEQWALASKPSDRGAQAFFGDGPRELASPSAQVAFFHFLTLDWREKPGAPTTAERVFPGTTFASDDQREIARALIATRPALYRVEAVERGVGFDASPVFPRGPVIRVRERAMSLSLRVGQLLPLRLVPAGPYHFAYTAGDPIAHGEEAAVERALRRKAGTSDPAEFVAREPAAFFRVVRAHAAT
jgi:hypothetical protein